MVDYTPQFRPLYANYAGKGSLIERVSDALLDSFNFKNFKGRTLKDVTDDFVVTTKNDFSKVTKDFVDGRIIYTSVIVGVGAGVLGNFTGAYVTDVSGGSHATIENVSLVAELICHGIGYAGTYIKMSKNAGKTKKQIYRDLTRTTSVSLPIALLPYPLVRNPLAEFFMDNNFVNIIPEFATVLSQVVLLLPYAKSVKYSVDRLGPKVDVYLDKIKYFKEDETKIDLI